MAKKRKSDMQDTIILAVGISILVAIVVAVVVFAPDDPFSDTEFVQDVGRRNQY